MTDHAPAPCFQCGSEWTAEHDAAACMRSLGAAFEIIRDALEMLILDRITFSQAQLEWRDAVREARAELRRAEQT